MSAKFDLLLGVGLIRRVGDQRQRFLIFVKIFASKNFLKLPNLVTLVVQALKVPHRIR